MKLIITHANCVDGCTAKAIFQKNYGSSANYLELDHADYNERFPEKVAKLEAALGQYKNTEVIMADICLPPVWLEKILNNHNKLVILDHHATSIPYVDSLECKVEAGEIKSENLYVDFSRDNTESGAELAWKYMHPAEPAPDFVKYVGDGDLWTFKYDETKPVYAALCESQSPKDIKDSRWAELLESKDEVEKLVEKGSKIHAAYMAEVYQYATQAQSVGLFGVKGLMVFAPSKYKSELGAELAKVSGTYGLVVDLNNQGAVSCSLRSASDFDVSELAKKAGGGGHHKAAAFRVKDLEDLYQVLDRKKTYAP